MESTESRYAHLLQPIRELTKNWEIDVASELNDYLEELDEMCITFDGETRLNFAEAALLIQGSACIYSKKVELLHSLVYQTLENINEKSKKRNKATAQAQDGDADAAESDHGAKDEFFSLDLDVSERSQRGESSTTPVSVAPLPPESLMPPETFEKQKCPLISVKGEVLCSLKDFRINLFIPGDEDLILLRLGSGSRFLLDPTDALQQQDAHGHEGEGAAAPPTGDGDADVAAGDGGEDGGEAADNFLPLDDNNMDVDQEPQEHIDRQQAAGEGRMIRERRQVERRRTEVEAPPIVNMWKLHDAYSVLGEDKPLKPGKCYKVPDGLEDGGKRKRKQSTALQDFGSWFTGVYNPPMHKLKNGPKFTDLNYIYLSTMKDRLKTKRRIYKKKGVLVSDEELRRTFLQPEQGEEPVEGFRHPELLGGDDDSDNDHEAFPDDIPAEFGGDAIQAEDERGELSYEDLVKLRVEQLVVNSQGYAQETALSRRVQEWEAMIRPELDQQEQRPVLDINEYGDRIVGALDGVGRRRAFSSIVHGLNNFEACKYLLASLQLANDYTVEIDSVEDLERSVDSMGLTLLSTHRATDRFKTMTSSSSSS